MIGKTISHFNIIKKIGEGGMGEVYLAEDTELDRKVALKFLPPHYTSDPEIKARFKREAKAAAALNHPNIITIHEVGEYEDKIYIAMEYVEGESLKDRIHKEKLSIDKILELALQMCEGLSKAHDAGIIHRDIKPENIIVDKDERIRILDFGLAKLKNVTKLTKESSTLGTLYYMSPEQLQGMEFDHRTDIWSQGVVMYEMITRQLPFQGEYEASFMYSVLNEEPKPLSEVDHQVPEQLELIVSKAILKNPEERYQAVSEISTDIRNLQKIGSVPPTKPVKKKSSWLKKLVLSFGALLLVIIGILAWYIYPFLYVPEPSQQKHDKAIAVLYFDNMSTAEDEYFADGLTEELISRLNRIQNLKVASRTDVRMYKLNPASIAQIGNDLSVDYVVEGSVRKASNRIRITAQLINRSDGSNRWSETYERELTDIFAVQDDVASNIASVLDMEISNHDRSAIVVRPTENLEAYDLVLRAKSKLITLGPTTPVSEFVDLHSMLERALELDPRYVDARSSLGGSYLVHAIMKDMTITDTERKRLLKMALSSSELVLASDPQNEIALTTLPIALIMIATEQWMGENEFKPLLYRKAKIKINRLAELYPNSPIANIGLGTFYYFLYDAKLPIHIGNEAQMAIDYHEKALEASERILKATPNDPIALYTAGDSYFVIGLIYYDQGRYQEALHYFRGQNEINLRTGNTSYEITSTRNLGRTFVKLGEYDEAIACFERALEIVYELERTNYISTNLSWLGWIYKLKGDYLGAFDYYNKALDIDREKDNKGVYGHDLHRIGAAKFFIGDYAEASEYFEEASELWTNIEDEKQNIWALSWWSISKMKFGNLEEAKAKAKETERIMEETEPHPNAVIVVNWNLSQVYVELGEKEKSYKFLKLAYDTVTKKSEEFVDSKARETFLNKIRENREVVAAWVTQKP